MGTCEICALYGQVHRDHDHASGFIRGLLCAGCNHGLARFKDDPKLMLKGLLFLLREQTKRGYMEWFRERHVEAQRRHDEAIRRRDRRAERYREKYATAPAYREKKKADNADYRKRAGIS